MNAVGRRCEDHGAALKFLCMQPGKYFMGLMCADCATRGKYCDEYGGNFKYVDLQDGIGRVRTLMANKMHNLRTWMDKAEAMTEEITGTIRAIGCDAVRERDFLEDGGWYTFETCHGTFLSAQQEASGSSVKADWHVGDELKRIRPKKVVVVGGDEEAAEAVSQEEEEEEDAFPDRSWTHFLVKHVQGDNVNPNRRCLWSPLPVTSQLLHPHPLIVYRECRH